MTMIPYMTEGPFGLDLEGKMMTYFSGVSENGYNSGCH